MINGDDEITNLKIMICNLDLSVETKEKLYNQAHKIRNQLQQKENVIKEVRELLKNDYFEDGSFTNYKKVFELLDKVSDDNE